MGKRFTAGLIIVVVLVIALVAPYIKNEYLTARYGDQFEELYKQTTMIERVDYLKVMEYTPTHAKICYVTKGENINVIEFSKIGSDDWQISAWRCMWSSTGSAGEFMYPFYF